MNQMAGTKVTHWYQLSLSLLLLASAIPPSVGQNGGLPTFATLSSENEYETINLQSLNVLVAVPVRQKAGAIPFSFMLLNNSGYWRGSNVNGPIFRNNGGFSGAAAMPGPPDNGWPIGNTRDPNDLCPDHVTHTIS
jgi:hypothetical protein